MERTRAQTSTGSYPDDDSAAGKANPTCHHGVTQSPSYSLGLVLAPIFLLALVLRLNQIHTADPMPATFGG
jgi:hypothetical protein